MRISIWGGTGYAGRHIAAEAAKRGHDVTVLSRTPGEPIEGVEYETASILEPADRSHAFEADIVVLAVSPRGDMAVAMYPAVQQLIAEATSRGVRLGVVGGAGSLLTEAGGPRQVDLPEFHEAYRAEALTLSAVLEDLRASDPSLHWFFVSPANMFGAGMDVPSTGSYRVGGDIALQSMDADGNLTGPGKISGPDFALAFVDEIEQNHHNRERFTVAS